MDIESGNCWKLIDTYGESMTQQIEKLLNDVKFKVETLRKAKDLFSDQLAPEFRIFDFLRTDEMGLSRCIACLLDPKGKHGQGSAFLEAFLEIAKVDWVINSNGCTVYTEKQANGQRRIDIYLKFGNGNIGIENKPWAGDQENQLSDYAKHLEKDSGKYDWKLVYICNCDPNENSLDSETLNKLDNDGRFIRLDYETIIKWLEVCACESKASVVRIFIEELAKFIRTEINGDIDMSEEREVACIVLESTDALGSAFQIFKVMGAVKKKLLKELHEALHAELKKEGLVLTDWGLESWPWRSYTGFNVQFGNMEQILHLRFQFDYTNLDGFCWGISRVSDKYHNAAVWEEIGELMSSNFTSGKTSSGWPWYSERDNEFDAEMRHWSTSEKPWIMIKNEKMAPKITQLAVQVRDAFVKNGKIGLLYEECVAPVAAS